MPHEQKEYKKNNEKEVTEEDKIDYVIDTLQEYIDDPSKVNKETLSDLREKVIELKENFLGEPEESEKESKEEDTGNKPVSIMIGIARRQKGEK